MIKRVLAILAIVLLVGMYVITLVFAIIDNPQTMNMLWASIGATVMVPVLIWVGMMFFGGIKRNKDEDESN